MIYEVRPPSCPSCGEPISRCKECGDKIVWLETESASPTMSGSCYDCGTIYVYRKSTDELLTTGELLTTRIRIEEGTWPD